MKELEEVILKDLKSGDATCRAFMTMSDPRGDDREADIIYKDGQEINIKILSEDFAKGIVEIFMRVYRYE